VIIQLYNVYYTVTQMQTVTLLYGSQTGCAQEVAERIGRLLRQNKINLTFNTMDDYDVVTLGSRFKISVKTIH
jgi:sulfite reductase alpha subunit-like flavoprotein